MSYSKPIPLFESLKGRSLNEDQVREIKKSLEVRGTKTLKNVAEELRVKLQTIRNINCGRVYRDVTI